MKIDTLIVSMITQARSMNHRPDKILLGGYMFNELSKELKWQGSGDSVFMGIKIEVSYEFPFLLGIV